jgi:hypothetical protein
MKGGLPFLPSRVEDWKVEEARRIGQEEEGVETRKEAVMGRRWRSEDVLGAGRRFYQGDASSRTTRLKAARRRLSLREWTASLLRLFLLSYIYTLFT